jgi:hypothetical protein
MTTTLAFGDTQAKSSLWWLPVAMIGFGAPAIAMTVLAPSSMDLTRMLVAGTLALMSIAAAAIYMTAVLLPGDLAAAAFDRAERRVRLTWVNPFAAKVETVAFEAVRDVTIAIHYDDDGYADIVAEAVLDDGRVVRLPGAVGQTDVDVLRAALGLAPISAKTTAHRRLR